MRHLRGTEIDETFAEAFSMTAARVVVTAVNSKWAHVAAAAATGYAASVIGCDAEAGIEAELSADETPDGRPGVALLFFAFSRDALSLAVSNRIGQCILTCPTTATRGCRDDHLALNVRANRSQRSASVRRNTSKSAPPR